MLDFSPFDREGHFSAGLVDRKWKFHPIQFAVVAEILPNGPHNVRRAVLNDLANHQAGLHVEKKGCPGRRGSRCAQYEPITTARGVHACDGELLK